MSLKKLTMEHNLASVNEITELTGVPRSTLQDWLKRKPKLLDATMRGCGCVKHGLRAGWADSIS